MATTHFGWALPTVSGSSGAWGGILNTAFQDVDDDVYAVKYPTRQDKGSVSGAITLDLSLAEAFTLTVGGAITGITISNAQAGSLVQSFSLKVTNGAAFAISWPASVKWASGTAPTLTAAGKDILVFTSYDGGSTWDGMLASKDSK